MNLSPLGKTGVLFLALIFMPIMDLSPLGKIGVLFSALVNTFMPIAIILIVAFVIDDLIGFKLMRKFIGTL